MTDSGFILPGWTCPTVPACGVFNGEVKSKLLVCRNCGTPRPETPEEARLRRMTDLYRAGKTIAEVGKAVKLSRARAGELLKKAGVTDAGRNRPKSGRYR